MKVALIAPPFISVPPKKYGGVELFIGGLAEGLQRAGAEVVLYANGESTSPVELRWMYEKQQWPIQGVITASLKDLAHVAWAVRDASRHFDIIHLNSLYGLALAGFVKTPLVYTIHHSYQQGMTEYYTTVPSSVAFVAISNSQSRKLPLAKVHMIHYGIDPSHYRTQEKKQSYLSFLGSISPDKGTHLAIEIAKEAGIPLKMAGQIFPYYADYWAQKIKPQVDGKFIEFVGEIGLEEKNELLGNSMAMLFPIQEDEAFGLVMIEAMACGTPVLGTPIGSVEEIVKEGVSGHVRKSVTELATCARNLNFAPQDIRTYFENNFSTIPMCNHYIRLYTQVLSGN